MMNDLDLIQALPEIILLAAACAILLIDAFLRDPRRSVSFVLTLGTLALCALVSGIFLYHGDPSTSTFGHMFVADPLANLLKLFSIVAVALTLLYSRRYALERGMVGGQHGGEFYVLILFVLLGQMVMISGHNLLVIYLGIELLSLPLYALTAMRRDQRAANEAAMKYFILGALASCLLLYGMSMLYGATATLDLSQMARTIASGSVDRVALIFGTIFLIVGLGFKLGVAPFHMWVPDVYQGAPTPVTLLIGGAPKLAVLVGCLRLLAEGLPALATEWQQMLMVMAVLSMLIGNVTALVQTNIKRMLAYSAIAQMGFMLLGLLSGGPQSGLQATADAYGSALFYAITYVLTTLGAFGLILLLTRPEFEADELDDFKGLHQRSPWFAFIMMLLMLSLAGLPPLVGFHAKLLVLQTLLATGQIWLAIIAISLSLIGAFYYLRVIKLMYFDEALVDVKITGGDDHRYILSLNGLAVLVLGFMPGPLMTICSKVILSTLKT